MDKILPKENFASFLADLQKEAQVIGPTRKGGGTSTYSSALFAPIRTIEDLDLDYKSTMLSPKKLLFPDNHVVYEYERQGGQVKLRPVEDDWPGQTVLFGVHPCDVVAIERLDKLFLEGRYQESTYKARREPLIIIGLTCAQAGKTCFCNLMGAGPDLDHGCDLLFTDMGGAFFVRSQSPQGEKLLQAAYFRPASPEEQQQREQTLAKVAEALPPKMDLERIIANLPEKYTDSLWDEFSDVCCSCGACNMVCPTCHCFSFLDRTNQPRTRGKRVLVWDPCHFERFALMAGGVNARGEKSARYKHRLYDKLLYDPGRHGELFCVGCGRCIEYCPAHIDLRTVLKKLEE